MKVMVQGHSSLIMPNDWKNVLLIKIQCSTEIQIWSVLILQWYVLIDLSPCMHHWKPKVGSIFTSTDLGFLTIFKKQAWLWKSLLWELICLYHAGSWIFIKSRNQCLDHWWDLHYYSSVFSVGNLFWWMQLFLIMHQFCLTTCSHDWICSS